MFTNATPWLITMLLVNKELVVPARKVSVELKPFMTIVLPLPPALEVSPAPVVDLMVKAPASKAMLPVNNGSSTFIRSVPAPPLVMLSAVSTPCKVRVLAAAVRMIASLSPAPAEGLKEIVEVIVGVRVLMRAPLSI